MTCVAKYNRFKIDLSRFSHRRPRHELVAAGTRENGHTHGSEKDVAGRKNPELYDSLKQRQVC